MRAATGWIIFCITFSGCDRGDSRPYNATSATNMNRPSASGTPSQCDPNYSGCVPIASDVDCAGGRGNGPAYVTGPVKVIGTDIYKLDEDGDGIGCE